MLRVIGGIGFTNNRPAFHRPVLLRIGQQVRFAGQLEGGSRSKSGRCLTTERIKIKADTRTHASGMRTTQTERQLNCVIGQSGLDMNWSLYRTALDGQYCHDGLFLTFLKLRLVQLLGTLGRFKKFTGSIHRLTPGEDRNSGFCFQFLGQTWTDQYRIVPGQFGHRIRALHHPAIVRVATISGMRTRLEADLQIGGAKGCGCGR